MSSPRVRTSPLEARASFFSLYGGVVFAVCFLLTALLFSALFSGRLIPLSIIVFGFFTGVSWLYFIDSITERLSFRKGFIERRSWLRSPARLSVAHARSLELVHEGLNQHIGIESLGVTYERGTGEHLDLGPCWRRYDLELFIDTLEHVLEGHLPIQHRS